MTHPLRRAQVNANKLAKRLRRNVGRAIGDFNMIGEGERLMVCLSGGKDSYTMLEILLGLQRTSPVKFELIAVNLDQKQPGFPAHILPEYLSGLGVAYHVIEQDTYSVVKRLVPEGKIQCGLCSRMRRGALYNYAAQHGITRVALGHHLDDMVETLFLNMFYAGRLKSMPPKLLSDDGRHVVIRPLAYCREKDITAYAQTRNYPIIPCTLCGSQPDSKRLLIKTMLREWEQKEPGRIETIFKSLQHVVPSHLIDPHHFDFASLDINSDIFTGSGSKLPIELRALS